MADSSNDYKWWAQTGTKEADAIFGYLNFLSTDQAYKADANQRNLRLYGNLELLAINGYMTDRNVGTSLANRVTLNVVQSMIDTVVSKIGKNKPRPMFLTEGGDFKQQRKAQKLTQFMEGQFEASDFYAKAQEAFQDSCIFGTGILKVFRIGNQIKVEKIYPDEIKVDDREALYGYPTQMAQTKYIHKDVLKTMFPNHKTEIEQCTNADFQSNGLLSSKFNKGDMLQVAELWKLPSGPKAKDGKHSISILGTVLFSEEYDKSYFPFVIWRWGVRPLGFFGQGISEQLTGIQLEINKILRTIQVSMHLVSVPKLFVEAGSKIVDAHLDNRIGSIIKYAGTPPTPGQLGVIPAELFSHLDRLYQRAYEIVGVSQLSAQQKKPSGLDSGKALRTYNDLETERFMSVAQRFERAFITAVPIFIDLAREIDAERGPEDGPYQVKLKGKKFLKTIKWKDVDLDDDKYELACFPTSALSQTPAGRLQDVQELIAAGFLSKEQAFKLLDYPDLQSFYQYELAPGDDIDWLIEKFIDGEYMTPEPYEDLTGGITKMQKAYLMLRTQEAPESTLELFRRWIEDANALLEKAAVDTQRQTMEAQAQVEQAGAQSLDESMPAGAPGTVDPDMVPPGPVVV